MVTLYTTHCPKCRILAKKLTMSNIDFTESENIQELIRAGYSMAPMLKLEDGSYLDFKTACRWTDQHKEN